MTELETSSGNNIAKKSITACLIIIFSYLFVIFAALHSADKPVGGGDTWVAMALGRYTVGPWAKNDNGRTVQMKILDMFGIHITWEDPISANSRPFVKGVKDCEGWVNQNWLSHVMFYKLKTSFGESSIVVYKFIQAILTALFAFWACRALKINYFIAAACAAFGVLLARSYIDMRPNISTILMAIIMITILFKWKAGQPKAVLWMLPLMIVWSNVHGGFIYAIVVFGIACGGYAVSNILSASYPTLFEFHDWKLKYKWLVIGFAITILTPMVFSPFGAENLLHPLLIMFGNEGKVWRNVSEWHPVYVDGFGNTGSFFTFCGIFAALSIAWIKVRTKFKLPTLTENNGSVTTNGFIFLTAAPLAWFAGKAIKANNDNSEKDTFKCMPTIDLTWLGIILLTFYMAISSRRFVFLAGVVLAPFMAIIIQQLIIMTREYWLKKISLAKVNAITAQLAIVCTIITAVIFVMAFNDIYLAPSQRGEQLTVFRRMVGIHDQPVRSAKFFEDNSVKGIVLNEWTNGGYVPWAQSPNEQTGRPACKVYMDGRAQAAYRVEHFVKWQHININTVGSKKQLQEDMENRQEMLQDIINKLGYSQKTPDLMKKLVTRCKKDTKWYEMLMYAMGVSPELYSEVLRNEKVNVLLVQNNKSKKTIQFLTKLPDWKVLYVDDRYTIIFDSKAPVNREVLATPVEKLNYPDEFSRNLSLANYYITEKTAGNSYRQNLIKADKLLVDIEDSKKVHTYNYIYRIRSMLRQKEQTIKFFEDEYNRLKKLIELDDPFGRKANLVAMHMCCSYLVAVNKQHENEQAAEKYQQESKKYDEIIRQDNAKAQSRWFW